ncbi:MAG: hypothetical protein ACYTEG_00780 [Planctomycetota bacterium]|jgi:hypothetical protein
MGITLTLAAVLFGGTACGGGGGDNLNVAQALQNCMGDGMGYLLGIGSSLSLLEDLIQSGGRFTDPHATVTPHPQDENTWNFEIELDLNNDGTYDTSITGSLGYSADPLDGIEPGDIATLTWAAGGAEGLSGSGNLVMTYGESENLTAWGMGSIDMPGNCDMSYDIAEQAPITFGFPRIEAINLLGSETFGTFNVVANYGSHSIEATLTLAQESNMISVSDAVIDDVDIDDFDFELEFDDETLFALVFCAGIHFYETIDLIGEIVRGLEAEFSDAEYDGGTLTVTTTGVFSANFEIVFNGDEGFQAGDTVTGSVAFSGDPQPGASISVTLRFNFTAANGSTTVTTSSSNPVILNIDLEGTQGDVSVAGGTMYGQVSCLLSEGAPIPTQVGEPETCRAVMTVPASAPLDLNNLDLGSGTGQITLESFFNNHSMRANLVVEGPGNFSARTYFDGIPVNSDIIFFIFD